MLKRIQSLLARWRYGKAWPGGRADNTPAEEPRTTRRSGVARLSELTQYVVLAGYCKHLKPGGAILELGCGEGSLHQALETGTFSRYVGVDRSEAAIRRAGTREDEKSSFVVEDLGYYIPRDRFDIIVLGACLRHLSAPAAVLQRYARYLKPHGLFLVALPQHDTALWSLLDATYREVDSVRVSGARAEYLCKAYSTRPAASAAVRRSSETPPSAL